MSSGMLTFVCNFVKLNGVPLCWYYEILPYKSAASLMSRKLQLDFQLLFGSSFVKSIKATLRYSVSNQKLITIFCFLTYQMNVSIHL